MKIKLEVALEECLDLLAQGESLASCLERYPDQAAELARLIQFAQQVGGLKPLDSLPATVVARQRRVFLQRAAELQQEGGAFPGFLSWLPLARMPGPARMALAAATVFILTLLIGGGAVLASGGDLGEALLQLLPEPVQEVLGLGDEPTPEPETVEFSGNIESIAEGSWVISGQTVLLDATTVVEGTPQVGLMAEGTALVQPDGSLLATHIEIQEPEFAATPTSGEPDDEVEPEEELEDEEEVKPGEEEAEEEEAEAEEEEAEDGDGEEDTGEDDEENGGDEDEDDDDEGDLGEDGDGGDEEDNEGEDEVTAEDAAAAILSAQAGILKAQTAINAAPEGVDISTAQEKVDEAWKKLGEAEAIYAEGDYPAALDKAEDASQLADDALDALADAAEDGEGGEEEGEGDTEEEPDGDSD